MIQAAETLRPVSNLDQGADLPLEKRIDRFHREYDALLEEVLSSAGIETPADWAAKSFAQSLLFAAEIIPLIHRLYEADPVNIHKSLLDIGPQNFAGTRLIQSIHDQRAYTNLKFSVSALDITDKFRNLQKLVAPQCEFIVSNLFDIKTRTWDLVIASHVIEHVPNPALFVTKMQEIATDYVVIAAPWNENPIVTRSHINTIDKRFVRAVEGRDLRIFTNYSWGKTREVCTFWVPGKAKKV